MAFGFKAELRAEIARLRLRVAELEELADRRGTIAVDRRRRIARLRMTDAEREAIHRASQYLSQNDAFEGMSEDAATLRGLLERTKGGER